MQPTDSSAGATLDMEGEVRTPDAVQSGALTAGDGPASDAPASDAVASEERRVLLQRELERYVHLLTTQSDPLQAEGPDKIIVFGSMASGEIKPWSDIDLVIVQRTSLPFMKRLRQIRQLFRPRAGTDSLVYTSSEFEQLRQERPFVQEEILEKGVVLYEQAS